MSDFLVFLLDSPLLMVWHSRGQTEKHEFLLVAREAVHLRFKEVEPGLIVWEDLGEWSVLGF